MTTQQQPIVDAYAIMGTVDQNAMRVREALLALLRSWEDMHSLPRSVPTWAERNPDNTRGGKHVKRGKE